MGNPNKVYTILLHKWFMESKGWEKHEVEAHDGDEAQRIAKALCYDRTDAFQRCSYYILPGKEKETI